MLILPKLHRKIFGIRKLPVEGVENDEQFENIKISEFLFDNHGSNLFHSLSRLTISICYYLN